MKTRTRLALLLLGALMVPSTVLAQVTVTVEAVDADASETGATGLFRITRSGGSLGSTLRADFLRNAGDTSCISGSDCTFDQPTISVNSIAFGFDIPAGVATLDVTVAALPDNLVEGPESVVLMLVENSNYVIGDPASAIIVIADDPVNVTVTATDPDATEGADSGTFRITRTGGNINDELRADFLRNAGDTSCIAFGGDCNFDRPTISVNSTTFGFRMPAGESALDINLTALPDNVVEGPETNILNLVESSAYLIGDPGVATVTIADDAAVVTVTATDPGATEGADSGTFRITRTGGNINDELRADFLRNAGDTSCIAFGGDCNFDQPTISVNSTTFGFRMPAGESALDINLTALPDNVVEGPETNILNLVESSAYLIGDPGVATVTIADDAAVVTVTATDPDATEGADSGTFRITRTGGNINEELRADFLRNAGDTSCITGSDCTFDQPTISVNSATFGFLIPAGESALDINLTALMDNLVEGPETVILTLVSSSAYAIGDPNSATLTIGDDAPIVTVTAPDSQASEEGDPGLFLISRTNGDLNAELRVDFARAAGPASCDSSTDCDYDQPTISVNSSVFGFLIAAGQASLEVMVIPTLEFPAEGPEDAVLQLVDSNRYLAGDPNTASVTIEDTELMFVDNFESDLILSKQCQSKLLAADNSARFVDLGTTIIDVVTGHEWSACALDALPASQAECQSDWLDDDLAVGEQLYLFNAGVLGDNAGFEDWRIPTTAQVAENSSKLRGCAIRK